MDLKESYEKESALAKYIPDRGDICLDVGCNEGRWTVALADRFRLLYAIDAQPSCLDQVNDKKLPNVICDHFAAWSNIGRVMFHTNVNKAGEHQGTIAGVDGFVIADREFEQYEVPCRPLDTLQYHGRIDFIKMDIDGAELDGLIGSQAILRKDKPTLLVEVHTDENRAFLLLWLKKFGYAPRIVDDLRFPADPMRWSDEVNYLYAPRS